MTTPDDDTQPDGFASPPCFLHELDPAYLGLEPAEQRHARDAARRQTSKAGAECPAAPGDAPPRAPRR
ncbi:hypothetical protein M2319_002059 [Rhodobium gokarnense]|uniref:Uncharacterized protein n=1 Tax=Rhodobium gokarnense TaxID=364296 RepID=A0ABT3HBE2_9HYPH|nr:hypothetical protein [Rhodobium gokarnense]